MLKEKLCYNQNGDIMNLLKKENWWMWLLIFLFSNGAGVIALSAILGNMNKESWYAKPSNWIIGFLCFLLPGFIMIEVFYIQMLVLAAARLNVKGKDIYLSPFIWMLLIIIPIIGWILLPMTIIYLNIAILIKLYKGFGEKDIQNENFVLE